jgi:hypothetical protein
MNSQSHNNEQHQQQQNNVQIKIDHRHAPNLNSNVDGNHYNAPHETSETNSPSISNHEQPYDDSTHVVNNDTVEQHNQHNEHEQEKEQHQHQQDDEQDDDDAEDDDEDEDEEPQLKYQRLGSSVPSILSNDSATCFVVHSKFLCVGTAGGNVHILDLNGNEIIKLQPHKKQINEISLDEAGDVCATCSTDGNN